MRNPKLLLFSMCLSWLLIGVNAQLDTDSHNDYGQKSYGIFVHYGWGGTEESEYGCQITQYPNGSYPRSVDETANNFDVQGFVDDIAEMGPEYLIFTAWHCGMNPLYPSDKMVEWLGTGHSSQRDVLQELLDACDAKDIDVYFYTQPSEAHDFSPAEQAAVGYIDRNTQTKTYNDFINEVFAEITERYKTQFKGFWFDKGLNYRCTDTKRIGETVRAIMPDAVLIVNGDANESADYGSVEIMSVTANFNGEGYPDADKSDEETWPAFKRSISFVSDRAWSSQPGSIRYTSKMMYKYTVLEAGVNEEGGGVAWAIGPYPTTTISWNNGLLSGMKGLGILIDEVGESIKGTVPSDSWPTAEGTTIKDLDWGIATRSADGIYEYLHVLKSPSGTTLSIDAPDDGREYIAAVNLRTGNYCSFSQTSSQVSITLNPSDSWDPVDAVIKLIPSGSPSVNYNIIYLDSLIQYDTITICGNYDPIKIIPLEGNDAHSWNLNDSQDTIYQDTLYLYNGFIGSVGYQGNSQSKRIYFDSLSLAGNDKNIYCGDTVSLNVSANYKGNGIPEFNWTPSNGLSDPKISNPLAFINNNTNYTITVNTPEGCTASTNISVTLQPTESPGPDICIVSIDSTNKNSVYWEKPVSTSIDSFLIFKESNETNDYKKIGSVAYNDNSEYIDTSSFPDIQSNKYKISLKDACGFESTKSNAHKTMYLAMNQGQNNSWNLIWEAYEGFEVSTYTIYRGTNSKNLQLIGTTSGSTTQYTDFSAPSGTVYYQIEVVSPDQCTTSGVINTSRSNITMNNPTQVKEIRTSPELYTLYPNPADDKIYIVSNQNDSNKGMIEISNLEGKVLNNILLSSCDMQVNINDLEKGCYIFKIKTERGISVHKILKK